MKVIHMITGLKTGGAEMMLYKTVTRLNPDKYIPIVISVTPIGSSKIKEYLDENKVKVYSLEVKNPLKVFSGIIKLFRILTEEKPVLIQAYLFHADFMARIIKLFKPKIILISSYRNENIGGKIREIMLRSTKFLSDHNTVVSNNAANELINKNIVNQKKTTVIINGVDTSKNKQLIDEPVKLNNNDYNILSIGRLTTQKNYINLIKSFSDVYKLNSNIRLYIVGEGELREDIENIIKELNLESKVILLGERYDIKSLLNNSDLFVLYSLWEGMPNVLIEAMGEGLPIIASNVGGVNEIIKDDENGMIVTSNNNKELVEALSKMINLDKSTLTKMRELNKIKVKNEFSIDKTIIETEKLYSYLLKNHK